MRRLFSLIACLAFASLSLAATASGQVLLINVNEHQQERLPRPIVIWPGPHPHPHPHPLPIPQPQPIPQSTYKIKELAVEGRLKDQIAEVQVSQTFVNTGSRVMEVAFVFPLPYDGAINRLTFMVDGKEIDAKLLDAKQARQVYESYVRKNQDPALLEWIGNGMFRTSVFPVPPGAERKVSLRYSQLMRKSEGATDFLFPLATAKYTTDPIEKIEFRLSIDSAEPLKNVYSPSHAVEVKRPDDRHATVTFSVEKQVPADDFRLMFDTGKGPVGAQVISYAPRRDEDGFFLLLASPEIETANSTPPPKTVVFVLDRSGSMSGKKMEQARNALSFVINNLKPNDLFNIIAFDSNVESFRLELQKFDEETRKAALGFIDGIYAGGSTNIDGALKTALEQLKDNSRPNYVIFMTDGLPTTGETNEGQILANSIKSNGVDARVFSFGVGYDLNARLLDKLTVAHRAQSEFVRPNEDIEARVSKLYNKIGAPMMTDVAITVDVEGRSGGSTSATSRVYPKGKVDLFAGNQLVMVGRYRFPGDAKVTVRGKVAGAEKSFDFPAKLADASADERSAFVEKIWASRRIGEIIDEIDLKGRNEELVKELVELSTRHGIMTPYTSFLAEEPNVANNLAVAAPRAAEAFRALDQVSGQGASELRRNKAAYKMAEQAPSASSSAPADFADASAEPGGGKQQGKASSVMNVGARSFYRRDGKWVDSRVTDKMRTGAVNIKRYSTEYFSLVDKHGKDIARYLAIEEPVVLEIDGKAYEF